MKTINFSITTGTESHISSAVIVDNYNEGLNQAETFFQENFEEINFKTNEIGNFEGYSVFENYIDSGSNDYFYFALKN